MGEAACNAWLGGRQPGGAATFKVKSPFSSCGISFKRNQLAIDLTQLDFNKTDRRSQESRSSTDLRWTYPGIAHLAAA